jgi:hypothetical protein
MISFMSVYILGIHPLSLHGVLHCMGFFCCARFFFWLQRLANILKCKFPFISFHPTEREKLAYFQSRTQHLVHTEQRVEPYVRVEPLCHNTGYHALLFVGMLPTQAPAQIPVGVAANNGSRCRCSDGPGTGVYLSEDI